MSGIGALSLKNGQTNVHDKEKSGHPSIVTDELVAKFDENVVETAALQ